VHMQATELQAEQAQTNEEYHCRDRAVHRESIHRGGWQGRVMPPHWSACAKWACGPVLASMRP
jgi:hypothetical protein